MDWCCARISGVSGFLAVFRYWGEYSYFWHAFILSLCGYILVLLYALLLPSHA